LFPIRRQAELENVMTDSRKSKNLQAPSWRKVLPVHPAAEADPMMTEAELRTLGEDIKARAGCNYLSRFTTTSCSTAEIAWTHWRWSASSSRCETKTETKTIGTST
jgi:hypothetical protein